MRLQIQPHRYFLINLFLAHRCCRAAGAVVVAVFASAVGRAGYRALFFVADYCFPAVVVVFALHLPALVVAKYLLVVIVFLFAVVALRLAFAVPGVFVLFSYLLFPGFLR